MKYTKELDALLRRRVALQHDLDAHRHEQLTHRRRAGDVARELAQVDAAIASHVEGATP